METITHRSGKICQHKVSKHYHHFLRRAFVGLNGLEYTFWRRVRAATVKQLKNESVESGVIMKHKPIQSTQRIVEKRKSSNVTFYSLWAFVAACLAVALYLGIKWRLGL